MQDAYGQVHDRGPAVNAVGVLERFRRRSVDAISSAVGTRVLHEVQVHEVLRPSCGRSHETDAAGNGETEQHPGGGFCGTTPAPPASSGAGGARVHQPAGVRHWWEGGRCRHHTRRGPSAPEAGGAVVTTAAAVPRLCSHTCSLLAGLAAAGGASGSSASAVRAFRLIPSWSPVSPGAVVTRRLVHRWRL